MKLNNLIIRNGATLQVAPHSSRSGYAATISECPIRDLSWGEVGHGHTITEAIDQAITRSNGMLTDKIYLPGDFK